MVTVNGHLQGNDFNKDFSDDVGSWLVGNDMLASNQSYLSNVGYGVKALTEPSKFGNQFLGRNVSYGVDPAVPGGDKTISVEQYVKEHPEVVNKYGNIGIGLGKYTCKYCQSYSNDDLIMVKSHEGGCNAL